MASFWRLVLDVAELAANLMTGDARGEIGVFVFGGQSLVQLVYGHLITIFIEFLIIIKISNFG